MGRTFLLHSRPKRKKMMNLQRSLNFKMTPVRKRRCWIWMEWRLAGHPFSLSDRSICQLVQQKTVAIPLWRRRGREVTPSQKIAEMVPTSVCTHKALANYPPSTRKLHMRTVFTVRRKPSHWNSNHRQSIPMRRLRLVHPVTRSPNNLSL
jgi:hypothetical protein